MADVLVNTPKGLHSKTGGFYVDPYEGGVATAVISHAHSDHARPGSDRYICSETTVPLLRRRVGEDADITGVPFGESLDFNGVSVSLHPAGHILGSAQVRVEQEGEVWVFTGDFKRSPDPTCRPFEVVECDTLITEATFALPVYRWKPGHEVAREVYEWWMSNRANGKTSLLAGYSLGKSQRLLAELTRFTDDGVLLHGALLDFVQMYRDAGVEMLPTQYVTEQPEDTDYSGDLVLCPPSALSSNWTRRFSDYSDGFASGWMRVRGIRRRRGYDAGFVMSDHADWPELLQTVRDTGASRVLATHGKTDAFIRYLREEMGVEADPLETAFQDEDD